MMKMSESRTDNAFPQIFIGKILERILLVECVTSALLARHLDDVVLLSKGDLMVLLELIELISDHISTWRIGTKLIFGIALTFFFQDHLSAFALPGSGSTS